MSSGIITPAFVEMFDNEVKQAYQGSERLAGTVRQKNGVVGSTARFTKVGKGMGNPHTPHADVTPMGVDYSTSTATLLDFDFPEYSDIFQQQKLNFDERRELVMLIADSMGRRSDQCNIDAAVASGTTNTVAVGIGGDNAFNMGKIRRMAAQFDAKGVPASDRHLAWSSVAKEQLLGTTKATSSDFNSVMALVSGQMDTFYGFKFHLIEDRAEGGLPIAGNNRSILAWHKTAIGKAVGINMKTEINYIAEKVSWLINGRLSLGCVAIDAEGVSIATIDESVSIV